MPVPFVYWIHPATGKRALYIGKSAMVYRRGRFLIPTPRD